MLKKLHVLFLTILSGNTGVCLVLAQLVETRGTAAAGDGGPAPAALLLPESCTAHRDPLCAGNTAGKAWDAASTAGHCYLSRPRLLGLIQEGWMGRVKDIMGGKVTGETKKNERKNRNKEKLNTRV